MSLGLSEIRAGEVSVEAPPAKDAGIQFIGRIRTPWTDRAACPKRGDPSGGPLCRIEVSAPWEAALDGIEGESWIEVLYWMHRARRDLVRQSPGSDGNTQGTFALRSPNRPNPIALSRVALIGIDGAVLIVRGLDCLDGTPLVDLKPEQCLPPRAGSTS